MAEDRRSSFFSKKEILRSWHCWTTFFTDRRIIRFLFSMSESCMKHSPWLSSPRPIIFNKLACLLPPHPFLFLEEKATLHCPDDAWRVWRRGMISRPEEHSSVDSFEPSFQLARDKTFFNIPPFSNPWINSLSFCIDSGTTIREPIDNSLKGWHSTSWICSIKLAPLLLSPRIEDERIDGQKSNEPSKWRGQIGNRCRSLRIKIAYLTEFKWRWDNPLMVVKLLNVKSLSRPNSMHMKLFTRTWLM